MSEEQQLRDEAARAERWAHAMTDTQMTERLMQIARDYLRRADELQRQASVPNPKFALLRSTLRSELRIR